MSFDRISDFFRDNGFGFIIPAKATPRIVSRGIKVKRTKTVKKVAKRTVKRKIRRKKK